jgi:predicted acylesterase/phospholipase RssA
MKKIRNNRIDMIAFFLNLLKIAVALDCLALVLEGGGCRGAYEAGVISVLTNTSNNISSAYNIISGISIGALSTSVMCSFPYGEELAMSKKLNEMWMNINKTSDLFVEWKGGLIAGALFHGGLLDNAPAVKFFRSYFASPQRNISVGSTNLDLGLFFTFNESLGEAFLDAAVASASIPFAFDPHQLAGYSWADGGCINNLDVTSAVERCLDVTDESHVQVDVVFDLFKENLKNFTSFKTPQVFERTFEILRSDSGIRNLYGALTAFPKIKVRYLFSPSVPLFKSLNFTAGNIRFNFQVGVGDAEKVILGRRDYREMVLDEFYIRKKTVFPECD